MYSILDRSRLYKTLLKLLYVLLPVETERNCWMRIPFFPIFVTDAGIEIEYPEISALSSIVEMWQESGK